VTRQLYAGAGKVGSENPGAGNFQGLQLAQRSDFIETLLSIETMTKRPLINTRDEPHAVSNRYRRLHLILGDANMSAYATALKVGTTLLVFNLIASEDKLAGLELVDPVADVLKVSLDKATVLQRKTGGTITALEIQEAYLEAAEKAFAGKDLEWNWILKEWKRTLDELRHSPEKLSDRIDWAIKEKLFTEFMQSEGMGWEDPWLKSLDLEYHNLDPDRGLYRGLQQEGAVYSLLSEKEIARAVESPPEGTRAQIRGQAVAQDAENIKSIHWTGVEFANGEILDLTGVICPEEVEIFLNSREQLV
jgi:proteasome accessory factor A